MNSIDNFYEDFNLNKEITEAEFELALDQLIELFLKDTSWAEVFKHESIRKTRNRFPHLNDMPLVCKAKKCVYAAKCPVIKGMTDEQAKKLENTDCRADRVFAVEQFSAFVKELKIEPTDNTDILNVANLVRYLIIKRRVDWAMAIDGMIIDQAVGISAKGIVATKRETHPLYAESDKIDKQIKVLQSQLFASRKDKHERDKSKGTTAENLLKSLLLGKYNNNALPAEAINFEENPVEKEEE